MEKNPSDKSILPIPDRQTIEAAHQRISPYIRHTPVMTSTTLNHLYNTELYFKCENFQKVGAFKARGATNTVLSLSPAQLANGVATHSSGNHAQALSWAAKLVGAKAYIVMPVDSSRVKVEAVRSYGGDITFCEPNLAARESTLKEILDRTGATEVHPYNDPRIIAGQATAARELLNKAGHLDLILAPVGGGGLLSGTALSAHFFGENTRVIAVEPAGADDAQRSFRQKSFIPSVNPQTIADGLRTSLGSVTFPVILRYVDDIVTVDDDAIIRAMRYLWERMKIVAEPSAAVPLAAVFEKRVDLTGKKAGIILSGGNVDLDSLPWYKKHE